MASEQKTERRALWELVALYAAEGIPYGFFAQGLPVFFRQEGHSLSRIGALGLLYLPWALKGLWAPVVDTRYLKAFGRRRTWIVGTQLGLVLLTALAAHLLQSTTMSSLWPLVLLVNLLAATQDIAVDGYAVSKLTDKTRGLGNAIQVCGYKGGMLLGGGVLLAVADQVDWAAAMAGLAISLALVLPFSWRLREGSTSEISAGAAGVAVSLLDPVRATLKQWTASRAGWSLLLLVTTVKVGESAASAMLKPAMVDHGFTTSEMALWVGTLGLGSSLLGSALGGWVVTAWSRPRALWGSIVFQAAGLLVLVPLQEAQGHWLGLGLVAEHLVTGVLTTVLFTYMMDAVDPRFGGTQYSVLASLVVLGTGAGSTLSGVVADAFGYVPLFAGCAVLTVLHLPLVRGAEAARQAALTSSNGGK